MFYIYNLTFTVSKGIVHTSAIDPEKEAINADLIKNTNYDSFYLLVDCINVYI